MRNQPTDEKFNNLERDIQPMPDWVLAALHEHDVLDDYRDRPAYQQNDYLSWITRAKQQSTQEKRLNQMIDELKQGGVYMKMEHPASRKD